MKKTQIRGKEAASVNRAKMRKKRYKKVNGGKGKKIGFFESIDLKIKGFYDGCKGFPLRTDKDDWYSPFVNQEINSFEEFCSHTWSSLQIENEDEYCCLEKLIDSIRQKKRLLEAAKADFSTAKKEKELTLIKIKVLGLEKELKNAEELFSALHSKLVEDANTTRLICHRVRNHILMRLDVYWNSVLRSHPDGASLSVVPVLELNDEAEEVYLQLHKELMKRADVIYDTILNEAKEKEVA